MFGSTRQRVTIKVDGRPTPAERDPNGGYWITHQGVRVLVPGSGAVTFNDLSGAVTQYSPRVLDKDDEAAVMAAKRAQVIVAAARPIAPKSERPSMVVKRQRELDRGTHEAIAHNAIHQHIATAPLNERVSERDVDELVELFVRCLIVDPALREQLREVLDYLASAVDCTSLSV